MGQTLYFTKKCQDCIDSKTPQAVVVLQADKKYILTGKPRKYDGFYESMFRAYKNCDLHKGGIHLSTQTIIFPGFARQDDFTPTKVSSDFEYVIRLYFSRFCPMGLAYLGSGFWKSCYSSGFKVGILNAPELNI